MPRGITEKDVFTACDALVLAGERPTIERVRWKIGRGSPNTVSPMLDAWFKGLGRRLQDPGAFAMPPDIPEPVLQASQHFWEVAQAQARGDLDHAVANALEPMRRELEAAQQAAAVLRAENESRAREMESVRGQLSEAASRLDDERLGHAATTALLNGARTLMEELRGRVAAAEAIALEAQARARQESEAAHERATGAERRAGLEIEGERAARSRAEKRTDALEKRIETLQSETQATSTRQLTELVSTRGSLELVREQLEDQRTLAESACRHADAADAALVDARLARERAEGHALGLQETVTRLEQFMSKADAKRSPKASRSSKP